MLLGREDGGSSKKRWNSFLTETKDQSSSITRRSSDVCAPARSCPPATLRKDGDLVQRTINAVNYHNANNFVRKFALNSTDHRNSNHFKIFQMTKYFATVLCLLFSFPFCFVGSSCFFILFLVSTM